MAKTAKEILLICINAMFSAQFIIAFSALCLSVETNMLIGKPLNSGPVLGFIFFGALTFYNLAFLGNVSLKNIVYNKNRIRFLFFIISFFSCLVFLLLLPQISRLLALTGAILSILYLYKLQWNGKTIQIRNIPLLKNILLAFIWSVVTVLIPFSVFAGSVSFSRDATLIFLFRFFFILSIAIPYDIRDYRQDRKNSLRTLPNVIGIHKTKMTAHLSLICFFILVMYFTRSHNMASVTIPEISSALYFSAFITGIVIMFANTRRGKYFYYLLLDGTMILQFFLCFWSLKPLKII